MAQAEGSEVSCIRSEEDLVRAIELGSWYESEEEIGSDSEETDSETNHEFHEVKNLLLISTN